MGDPSDLQLREQPRESHVGQRRAARAGEHQRVTVAERPRGGEDFQR